MRRSFSLQLKNGVPEVTTDRSIDPPAQQHCCWLPSPFSSAWAAGSGGRLNSVVTESRRSALALRLRVCLRKIKPAIWRVRLRHLMSACIIGLALLECRGSLLCGLSQVEAAELHDTILDRSKIEKNQDSSKVQEILGPPPIVFDWADPNEAAWFYPVRIPHGRAPLARAALLKVWLDANERVERWEFLHPLSMRPLVIRESIEEADDWRREMPSKLCYTLRRIELASVLRAGTPMAEVLKEMRWFSKSADLALERSFVTVSKEKDRKVLTFYAERPSPLFIPSFYFAVLFSKSEHRVNAAYLEGYGGCQ